MALGAGGPSGSRPKALALGAGGPSGSRPKGAFGGDWLIGFKEMGLGIEPLFSVMILSQNKRSFYFVKPSIHGSIC